MRIFLLAFIVALFFSCTPGGNKTTHVGTILYNATIYTLNDSMPIADAMAIDSGKIIAIGKKDELIKKYTAAKMEDMYGAFVYPGFIDGHAHFYGLGMFNYRADLTGSKSFDELLGRLQQFAATHPDGWLLGRGWDQNLWENKQFPDKTQLDNLFPNRPVLLKRVDGHAALVNQKALDLAAVTINTPINGGKLETKNGKLTGLLVDNAVDLVEKAIPPATTQEIKNYLLKAQEICFANGLTTVVDPGLEKKEIDVIKALQDEGQLKIRLDVMVSADEAGLEYYIKNGPVKTARLNVSAFKVYGDGALGSRGACLLQPYNDDPGNTGFLLQSPEKLREIIQRVSKSNFRLCTHTIGDSTCRFILDEYGKALGTNNNRRWRIEHAQIVHPADTAKFRTYNILPSMQPTHAISDMEWADERLGTERIKTAYLLKTLMQQNGLIVLGTDFPVEKVSPIATFYTAVERKDANGNPINGFQPENALSRIEALKGMTIWAAYGSFEENEKGSITPGKYADFTVLDRDIMIEKQLQTIQVIETWVDGEKVFSYKK